jgi:hypothetical protein
MSTATRRQPRPSDEVIHAIVEAAHGPSLLGIVYRKSVIEPDLERLIEPYAWSQGKSDLMLRAYQLQPAEGWRFFMVHRIAKARIAQPFTPRRKVNLTTGEIHTDFESWNWPERVVQYRALVLDVLADMEVNEGERQMLDQFRQDNGIRPEEMLGVHYQIFQGCLNTMLGDGLIESHESGELKQVNGLLKRCGAGVVE